MSTAPRIEAAKRDWGHDETGCTILHIDMDAFFASLEIARHPEFRGKPVIVGTGNRAVVSAASYEARKYGINSAMPAARAHKLCPNGIFLPVDHHYYSAVSHEIFHTVFREVTDRIEQVSVDECYMDVSGALLAWHSPTRIAQWLRAQVAERFGITCSVGIAGNKLVAKMASTNAKPNGMLLIPLDKHAQFVQLMPLRGIPGLGPAQEKRLNAWGINSVSQLARCSVEELIQATGSKAAATHLWEASHGIDPCTLTLHAPEKSIGQERTFDTDCNDLATASTLIKQCCDKVASILRAKGLMARTLTVKLRFPDLAYSTKQMQLEQPTDAASTLYPHAIDLLLRMMGMPADCRGTEVKLTRPIRLAGISTSTLTKREETVIQPTLDELLEENERVAPMPQASSSIPSPANGTRSTRLRCAEEAVDQIRRKFGQDSAHLGA